jgi:hypothetical protein
MVNRTKRQNKLGCATAPVEFIAVQVPGGKIAVFDGAAAGTEHRPASRPPACMWSTRPGTSGNVLTVGVPSTSCPATPHPDALSEKSRATSEIPSSICVAIAVEQVDELAYECW